MDSIRKWLYRPKREDRSLLAQFFFADEELNAVATELDSFDGRKDPERCTALVNHLRHCQDKVLNICNRIMDQLIAGERAPRDFRVKFPDDVLQENLAGQLWFGAECLAAGSSIMNHEAESAAMRPLAKALTKSLETVRSLLREQCFRTQPEFGEKLRESLKIFDRLFAEFELSYVSAMVTVKTVKEYELQQNVIILFSETLQRALHMNLLTQEMVDDYDPALMFTIPRLAIVCGLIVFPDGPLSLERGPEHMSEMFRPFRTLLRKIRELLWTLSKAELFSLEKALCSAEDPSDFQQSSRRQADPPPGSYQPLEGVPDLEDFVTRFYHDYPSCKQFIDNFYTCQFGAAPQLRQRQGERSTELVVEDLDSVNGVTDVGSDCNSFQLCASMPNALRNTTEDNNSDPNFENRTNVNSQELYDSGVQIIRCSNNSHNVVSNGVRSGNEDDDEISESDTMTEVSCGCDISVASTVTVSVGKVCCRNGSEQEEEGESQGDDSITTNFETNNNNAVVTAGQNAQVINETLPEMNDDVDTEVSHPSSSVSPVMMSGFLLVNQISRNGNALAAEEDPTPDSDSQEDLAVAHHMMSAAQARLSTLLIEKRKQSENGAMDNSSEQPGNRDSGVAVSDGETSPSDIGPHDELDKTDSKDSGTYETATVLTDDELMPESDGISQKYVKQLQTISCTCGETSLKVTEPVDADHTNEENDTNVITTLAVKEKCDSDGGSGVVQNCYLHSEIESKECPLISDSQGVIPNIEVSQDADKCGINEDCNTLVSSNSVSESKNPRCDVCIRHETESSSESLMFDYSGNWEAISNTWTVEGDDRERQVGSTAPSWTKWKAGTPSSSANYQHRGSTARTKSSHTLGIPMPTGRLQEVSSSYSSSCSSCQSSMSSESCSSDTSSFHSECQDDEEIALAMQAAEIANRNEARSKFRSSEDLIHRLFVCIAGVADQLQTNFAGDLRNILKCVFIMNATEPLLPPDDVPTDTVSSSGDQLRDSDVSTSSGVESAEEALPSPEVEDADIGEVEPQENIDALEENGSEAPPPWVPDQMAPRCMSCKASFTVVRRRHHCRNCGKVFCARCSSNSVPLPRYGHIKPVRVCNHCFLYQVTPFTLEQVAHS